MQTLFPRINVSVRKARFYVLSNSKNVSLHKPVSQISDFGPASYESISHRPVGIVVI